MPVISSSWIWKFFFTWDVLSNKLINIKLNQFWGGNLETVILRFLISPAILGTIYLIKTLRAASLYSLLPPFYKIKTDRVKKDKIRFSILYEASRWNRSIKDVGLTTTTTFSKRTNLWTSNRLLVFFLSIFILCKMLRISKVGWFQVQII